MKWTIISETIMMTAICSLILQIRKNYAKRRRAAHKVSMVAAKMTSRRERDRKIRMTSMKAIKKRIRGQLRRGDAGERRRLERAAVECKEDVETALASLHECTFFLDNMMVRSEFVKDAKYKAWEMALDQFLVSLKDMVHYSIKPRREDEKMVNLMIRMLSQMRIAETMTEQMRVRWNLRDSLINLLDDANKRFRRMGL